MNLGYLGLAGAEIDDDAMPAIAQLRLLEVLDLSETQVTDAGLLPLGELQKLHQLDLSGTKVSAAWVKAVSRAVPTLHVVK